MPSVKVTAPDGTVYNVTAPEGATDAEIMARVQAEHSRTAGAPAPTSPPSALGASGRVDQGGGLPRDLTGRIKEHLTREPKPGGRSLFGEPEVLAPVGKAIRAVGRFALPETNIGAGAMAGTLAAGPAAPLAGFARVPALARILGGAVGGEAAGTLSGEQAGKGALVGGSMAAVGEGAGAALGKLVRSAPGMKSRIAGADAAGYAREAGRISPPLAGARSAEDLRALASGPGRARLGQAKESAVQQVEGAIGNQPISVGGQAIPLREANDRLSEIGARAFSKNPLDRTFQGVDQRQLYGQTAREIEQGLSQLDPTGAALKTWQQAQQAYSAGTALLRPLQTPQAFRTGKSLEFNTPYVQRLLANPKAEAALRNKLGDREFEALRNVMLRGGRPGGVDVLSPGGRVTDALMEILRGKGGATQIPALVPRTLLPNLGSRYTGRQPYSLPPKLQTILDLAAQRGAEGAR
jgi:hypothetical protein